MSSDSQYGVLQQSVNIRTNLDSVFSKEMVNNLWNLYITNTQDSLSLEDFEISPHDELVQNVISIIDSNSNKFTPLRNFVSLH